MDSKEDFQNHTASKDEIASFLASRVKDDCCTTLKELPSPSLFKDIQKATQRVVDAINTKEQITIVGDYDVDGIVSTTIMVEFFKKVNIDVSWIVPNRFKHGYGLSPKIVEQINTGLVITVDNGISAIEAARLCKDKGLDLIITDHHTVGEEIPDCFAIVNPKQSDCNFPYKDICGAQVAWYFCASIKNALNININLLDFFDILAIAIVADVMPMRSINAAMVKKGLKQLLLSNRTAILALNNHLKKATLNEEDIGFSIAPLLNSSGRMEDASIAVNFLLSNDSIEVNKILEHLKFLNTLRKDEQSTIYKEALLQVDPNDNVIVVVSENWNEGIIGIAAAKLCEKFKKPAFVFSINGDTAKGSSRSINDISLYELLQTVSDTTLGFGGHKGAAGVVVKSDSLQKFKNAINQSIETFTNKDIVIRNNHFCLLQTHNVNIDLYNILEQYRPFGLENELPIFKFNSVPIIKHHYLGKEQLHQKLILQNHIELLLFNNNDLLCNLNTISFTATISLNEFRGNVSINLIAKEIFI